MSDGPTSKKRKLNYDSKKQKCFKQKRNFIEPGQRGFLATCNFRERGCIRECYNILNHFADELYGPVTTSIPKDEPADPDIDIADTLQQEINATKKETKDKYRFQVVDTGTNCVFVKTTLDNPVELGHAIVKDIYENKTKRSRHLLRLVPIEAVCKANLKDIINAAGSIFDRYFLKEPKTFSVIYNKRFNNSVKRDEVIKELAELVASKNLKNKVDLKNPELSVIVEIMKGMCCLSVLPTYYKYKKFNLVELAAKDLNEVEKRTEEEAGDDEEGNDKTAKQCNEVEADNKSDEEDGLSDDDSVKLSPANESVQ